METKIKLILMLTSSIILSACSVFGGKAADEPNYIVSRSEDIFEIREYPELIVAYTATGKDYEVGRKEAFYKLFDYISGKNKGSSEIKMTAPVLMNNPGASIPINSALIASNSKAGWEMLFVMPESFTLENTPVPTDPDVKIRRIAPKKMAVIKFSGTLNDERFQENKTKLAEWIRKNSLISSEDYITAGYNPPWTLPFLRRNEVMVELK